MTSPVILDTHGAVEPSFKSRNLTEIMVNASKDKKELVRFHTQLQDERRRQNRFAKSGLLKLAESDKGNYYYNQEKWLQDDKAPEKPLKPPRNRV